MSDWNNLRKLDIPGIRFVIRNVITGAYIHESLLKIMEFDTRSEAQAYIRQRGLNRYIYFVEGKYE